MIFKSFIESRLFRNVFKLMGGTAIAQIIGAASLPLITRLYSPDEFGLLSVFLSFFSFGVVVLTLRYESALLNSVDELEAIKIFRICRFFVFLSSVLVSIILFSMVYYSILGFEILPYWAVVVGFVSFISFGFFMTNRGVLLRFGDVSRISRGVVSRALSNMSSKVVLGLLSFGPFGLLLGEAIGSIFAMIVTRKARYILRKQKEKLSRKVISFREYRCTACKFKRFPTIELPSAIINQLTLSLPIILVADLFGAKSAGIFGLARTLYAIPNTQIGGAVADVFHMELSKCLRLERPRSDALNLFIKFSKVLLSVALLSIFTGVYLAPLLAGPVFGNEWTKVGQVIALMAPWMASALVASSLGRALLIFERQDLKLIYDVFSVLIVLISFWLTTSNGEDLLYFVRMLSFGMLGAYLIYYFLIYYVVKSFSLQKIEES